MNYERCAKKLAALVTNRPPYGPLIGDLGGRVGRLVGSDDPIE